MSSSTGQLKPVFLYVISVQSDGNNRPVFQVLSQRHTSDFISYFMKYWRNFNNNKKNPHEIIMDNSDALILASIQSFTPFQTRIAYLDACYYNLFQDSQIEIGCYIRLDRSHIVKQIKSMKIFDKVDYRVKKLLQRILGYLITATDMEIVENIIRNLFMLILNKYEHDEAITEAKRNLKRISDDHNIDSIMDSENFEEFGEVQDIIFKQNESKFKIWIKNIIQEVREKFVDEQLNDSITDDLADDLEYVENLYYVSDKNKDFVSYLVDFLAIIPLWSNIMMESFGSENKVATSSPTEATFKNMKVIVFKNEISFRPDVFLEKYLTYLLGNFKFALASSKNKQEFTLKGEKEIEKEKETTEKSQNEGACSLVESNNEQPFDLVKNEEEEDEGKGIVKSQIVEVSQEIWRDKNVDVSQPKKLVKSNRSVNSILEKAKPFTSHLPILPNGATTKGNRKNPTIISHNTCPFDALYQIYAAFFKDIQNIQTNINRSDRQFDIFIRESFFKKNIDELNGSRNHIFLSLFPERVFHGKKNIRILDVFMTINEMFNKLSENSNVIFSMKTKTVCGECNSITNEKIHKYVPMRFVGEWKTIIGDIQAFTEFDSFNSEMCPKCSILLDSHITYNDVVVIHIEMAYPDTLPHLIEMDKISNYILLSDKLYEFRAAVQYTSNHFIAHIKRNDDVWQTYDDLKSSVQKPTKSFYSVQYYYVKVEDKDESE